MKRKKRIKAGGILIAVLLLNFMLMFPSAAASSKRVTTPKGNSVSVRDIDGEEYISLYATAKALGGSGSWNTDSFTMTVRVNGVTVSAKRNADYIVKDGEKIYAGKNRLKDNVLYVPLKSGCSALGYRLQSDASGYKMVKAEKYDADQVLWLARIIYAESRGQPYEGQLAVGTVVMNRVASPAYPNTIFGVIFDKKYGVQFTPAGNGTVWCTPDETAVRAAKQVLDGYRTDPEILFFMNAAIAKSSWIKDHCEYAFTIADHSFYK